jgi:adenosylhomocysteine nucleosidase
LNDRGPRETFLGIVAALEAEARTLGPGVRRRDGTLRVDGALLMVSGMGGGLAAAAARSLVEAGVSALLSFGFAGGLDPALRAGQVVLPSEVISAEGTRVSTSSEWRLQLSRAIAAVEPVGGMLLSATVPIATVEDKAALFRETGAVAVDMESLAIAQVAAAHGLPFMAVRVIVDGAADALPRAVAAAARGGHLSVLRIIGGLVAAPRDLVGLLRLSRRYRAATRSLAAVARDAHIA